MKGQISLTIEVEVVFSQLAQVVGAGLSVSFTEDKPAKSWFQKIAEA